MVPTVTSSRATIVERTYLESEKVLYGSQKGFIWQSNIYSYEWLEVFWRLHKMSRIEPLSLFFPQRIHDGSQAHKHLLMLQY